MFEIVQEGLFESESQILELTRLYTQLVIPSDDDLDVTHWWVVRHDGAEVLYLGTPETFVTYIKERNGGVQ